MLDTLGVRVGAPQGQGLQGSVGCTVSGRLEREMLPTSLASPSVFGERVKLDMLVSELMLLVKRRAS